MKTPTPNIGYSEEDLKTINAELARLLSNTYLLYTKTQVSHWNVVSQRFHSLHQMFEEQYTQLATAVDDIAERMRTLGQKSPLGLMALISLASLKDYDKDLSGEEMVQALLEDHEHICRELRSSIEVTSKLGDEGTVGLLTARLEEHEKTAWILRSSLA